MPHIQVNFPMQESEARQLRAGQQVLITGTIYTARDAAHLKLNDQLKKYNCAETGMDAASVLPIALKDQLIYYVGPTPARPGRAIGACGPTTSYRMDDLTLPLLELGLRAMMGKGDRSQEVIEAMVKYGAVYFAATGGAGALLATRVLSSKVVAYDELGAEAIHELVVKDFPAIVAIDTLGNNAYHLKNEGN